MKIVRSLITNYETGDISRDKVTNTVYHTSSSLDTDTSAVWTAFANKILAAFIGTAPADASFSIYNDRIVEVRCYDMADAIPRPEKAFVTHDGSAGGVQHGPPELAVVLSFFAGRNIPGLRSKLFIGPVPMAFIGTGGTSGARPSSGLRTVVLSLGAAIHSLGGATEQHVILHPKATKSGHAAGSIDTVTDYNVSDSWGAVHSRNLRPSTRTALHP